MHNIVHKVTHYGTGGSLLLFTAPQYHFAAEAIGLVTLAMQLINSYLIKRKSNVEKN